MIKQESSIWIDRQPEANWQVIADPMSYPKWDPGLLEVTPTSPGAPRVGSTFRAAQMLMGRRTALSIQITEVDTYKRAARMVTADIAEVSARYTLEPEVGGTRVHRYVEAKLKERVGRLRITEWTPPNRMELQTRLVPMEGSLSYQLEPVERGTRVAAGADVDIRAPWRLLAPLVVSMFTRDGAADLANLKRIL